MTRWTSSGAGPASAGGRQRVTFPALMQDVHTLSRWAFRPPWRARPGCWGSSGAGCGGASGRPCCRSPAPCRRCRRQKPRDRSVGVIEEVDAAPAPPGPAVEGYPTPRPAARTGAAMAARHRAAAAPLAARPAYPGGPWRAWTNRCATRWAARPRPRADEGVRPAHHRRPAAALPAPLRPAAAS